MSGSDQQIVTAYEDLGLNPEQIAEDGSYDIVAIKACLMQNSVLFREAMKQNKEEGFSNGEEQEARQVIAQLMRDSEDDFIKLRAAKYIRDDKRGRLDPVKAQHLNISVVNINASLRKAREARARVRNTSIDIQSVTSKTILQPKEKDLVLEEACQI